MKCGKRIVLFTLFAMNLVDQPAPEVTIAQGTLTGKISADGTFFEYMGIPYATTNSSTRFKAPLPAPAWNRVFKATEEIYSCPQSTPLGIIGTEDCLKINVYVPAFAQRPLPVMVYIHGGAFIVGSGGKLVYAPEFLVKHDVIIVTFNYRLGALGFLCLGIEDAPGNAGLKDQIAALKWVKKNIAAFGGDPDNITIFGESAGAMSTSILIASDATNGLFNRAIIQSGSSLSSRALNRRPTWIASLLTKELGYNTEDPQEIYKILSELPYEELMKLKPTKPLGMYFDTQLLHLPCIEKPFPGIDPVLTDLPYNLLLKKQKNIPVILGSASNEGLFLIADENAETLEERNTRYLFASDLEFKDENEAAVVAKRVKEFYFGEEKISLDNILNVSDVYTHLGFEMPSILESEVYLSSNNATVYNYYFDYQGGRNLVKGRTGYSKAKGSCHGDDLFYIFDTRVWPFKNTKDKVVIDHMTTLWTNFAKFGDPTPLTQKDIPVRWEPSHKDELKFLYIQDSSKMGSLPNPKAYDLWKDLYTKYRRTNLNGYLAPLPAPSWEGVFKATDEIYSCPQPTPLGVIGTEDCLKINVYVPAFAQRPLPVMVYIHGGAFIIGSGGKLVYAPEFLVKHDVIIVTFNYRLGALGFICLGIEDAPGNAGLKDQIAALKWIKKNIAAFGGDPENITIFGESAGATSTAILIASEATNGLFNRAIIQSGSSLSSWSVNRQSTWIASLLTKELGYDTEDPQEIYKILSELPYKELIELKPKKPLGMYFDTQLLQLPCIEKSFPGIEPVLTDLPYNLILKKPKNIPVIIGSVSNEGLFLIASESAETLEERNTRYLFASDLEFKDENEAAVVAKRVKEFYFGEEIISLDNILNVSDIYTHLYFEMPIILESEVYLSNNNAPVFNYYFDYQGGRNVVKDRTGYSNAKGSCHGDDLLYLFDARIWPFKNSKDKMMIDFMTTLWTNFAKYGDPTPPTQKDIPVRWEPSRKEELKFLYIQDSSKMGPLPNPKAYELWKDIYTKYRRTNVNDYL